MVEDAADPLPSTGQFRTPKGPFGSNDATHGAACPAWTPLLPRSNFMFSDAFAAESGCTV